MKKAKRHLLILTATLLTFVLGSTNIQSSRSFGESGGVAHSEVLGPFPNSHPTVVESSGRKITIFFHGLMVGRFKTGKRRFEVGVVKNISNHRFTLQVKEGDQNPIDITPQDSPGLDIYEFDISYDNGEPTESTVERFTPQGNDFNRMSLESANNAVLSQDFRYLPDLEGVGLHNKKRKRKDKSFNFVFYVLKGVIMSKCLTEDIIEKKKLPEPETGWMPYGFIAEIIGVDITLLPGQQLVLRKKSDIEIKNEPLWRCIYSPTQTVEARVLHLPITSKDIPGPYLINACVKSSGTPMPTVSHFQYYYNVFDVKSNDRYDLRAPGVFRSTLSSQKSTQSQYEVKTIFPYQCGMVFQSKSKNDIDKDDVNQTP